MSATVNNKMHSCGRDVFGTFTHTEGEANPTVTVAGYVWVGIVQSLDTDDVDVSMKYSVSRDTTTGISTITIHCTETVADGRFWFKTTTM